MTRQSRPGRARGLAIATATAALALPLLASTGAAQATPGTAATSGAVAKAAPARLTCAARTAPQHPITLTPPLRDAPPQPTKGQGIVLLENCSSPDGQITDIASGRVEVKGTALASCRSVADLSGTGTVTWRDAQGRIVGTSQLNAEHRGGVTLTGHLLEGSVASGRLKGRQFTGEGGTLTSDLRQCTTPAGLTELTGTGRISFA